MRGLPFKTKVFSWSAIGLLIVIGFVISRQPAAAGPITASAPIKTAVYQGVVSVVACGATASNCASGSSVMEIGAYNNANGAGKEGMDIASTSSIFFRPEGSGVGFISTNLAALRITKNGTAADLMVPGNICFNGAQNRGVDCRYQWTSGNPVFWNQFNGGGITFLYPSVLSRGVSNNGPSNASVSGPYTMEVYGNNPNSAFYAEDAQGSDAASSWAMLVDQDAYIRGNIVVDGDALTAVTIPQVYGGSGTFEQSKVWYAGNDGLANGPGQGPDADKLDGVSVYYKVNTSGGLCNLPSGNDNVRCVCGDLPNSSGGTSRRCLPLP